MLRIVAVDTDPAFGCMKKSTLILRSRAQHGVSKDGTSQCLGPSFETAAQERGLLKMRSVGYRRQTI
jgi:hypothetical protein